MKITIEQNNQNPQKMKFPDDQRPPLSYGWVNRDRWNVLDLLNLYGMKAITTHLFYDINMEWVEKTRKELKEKGKRITVTAFLLKAIALAQKNHPASRTLSLPGVRVVTFEDIVAGFTVERMVKDEPIVFFGEIESPCEKSMEEIAKELRDYAQEEIKSIPKLKEQLVFTRFPWLARQLIFHLGAWIPSFRLKCMKATFGVSSLGSLGVNLVCGPSVSTSVFGVGQIEEKVIVVDKKLVHQPIMNLSLSFDQRVMDGGQAAQFVLEIKELLEGGMAKYL